MTLTRAKDGRKRTRGDGLRRCVGCGAAGDPARMIRFRASPSRTLVVDTRRIAGGRGVYVCYDSRCIDAAVRKRRLCRALTIPGGSVSRETFLAEVLRRLEETARHEVCRAWRERALMVDPGAIRKSMASGWVRMLLSDPAWWQANAFGGAEAQTPVPVFSIAPVEAILNVLARREKIACVAVHKRASTGRLEDVFRRLDTIRLAESPER